MISWGLCIFCVAAANSVRAGQFRWVRTKTDVTVPVGVTVEPGGPLVPVVTRNGDRRVDRRRDVDRGRPGFRPHWESCTDPDVWSRERTELRTGVPTAPPAVNPMRGSQLGPCAGCYRPDHIAYGPDAAGTLCTNCQQVLAAWRSSDRHSRTPLHYPRWKGGEQ